MKRALIGLPLLLAVAMGGCGKKPVNGLAVYAVRGKVAYQGRPAANFRVAFHPATTWAGPQFAPSGVTDSEGRFIIGSYKADDGAPAGEYAVTFTWPKHLNTMDDDSGAPEVDQLRGQYADPQKSTFQVSVREGQNELQPFELK